MGDTEQGDNVVVFKCDMDEETKMEVIESTKDYME